MTVNALCKQQEHAYNDYVYNCILTTTLDVLIDILVETISSEEQAAVQ
jgi:hypothetical protein